ncbi:MAG: hypothetical protein N3H31_06895 [Candidatus Nezhaarchaeota archaeon]|nr:hypothetical protein [Candidatus Nezhaarchaeota archaeon]
MAFDELHALLRGENGLGRIAISYNAHNFDIYLIIEGGGGLLIVNPIGKIVTRLSKSWKYRENLFSFMPYLRLGLNYFIGRLARDPFAENIRAFIEHVERGRPLNPSLDLVLNQVKTYEEVLGSSKA